MKNTTMKDWTVFTLGFGLILLLIIITIGDFYVSLKEHRPVDDSVIELLSMAVTGVVGIVAGYISGRSNAITKD